MRAALRLIWTLDVRHLVAHRARLALSALGIAVGVALAVAVGSLSSSIAGSLNAVAQAAATTANVEVRANGTGGLQPELLGAIRDAPGVVHAGATVESYVKARANGSEQRILVMGIDSGIIEMSPADIDPEALRGADPTGLFVPSDLAGELGLRKGDTFEITSPTGWKEVKVGAVLPPGAAERGRVAIGTVGVLQPILERGTTYDAIYVEASDAEAGLVAVRRAVGDKARVGPLAFRGEQIQQLLAGANASFSVGTVVALFVGAFLVYNTMAMAAVERMQEAALLRAVGAKRRQVFSLFLTEGALLGVIGSGLGIALGLALSSQMLGQQGSALEEIFPIQITKLTVSSNVLVAAGIAGVVASIAAAFLPARRIARADVAPALGPTGALEDPTMRSRRSMTAIGIAFALIGPVVAIVSVGTATEATPVTILGFAITLTGIAFLIPRGVPFLAGLVLGAVARHRRTTGVVRLAIGEVLRSPGRTSYTVGAVLLSLALVVGFSIAQSSFTRAFSSEFEDVISADIYLRSPTWRPFGSDVPVDERLADEIEEIDGVAAAWPFRFMPVTYEGRSIAVIAYDLEEYATHTRVSSEVRAEYRHQADALADGIGTIASSSLLSQFQLAVGDEIALPTPTGRHQVEIVGSFQDPAALTPEIFFDYDTFKELWGTGGADSFGVVIDDPSRVGEMVATISEAVGDRYGVVVDTREEYLGLLSGAVNSVVQLISSVQLVAVIVAALGLANTLLISTFERRRDFGVLRAVGMLRRQLRRMVAAEALIIGLLGVSLAWALGTVIGVGMFMMIEAQLGIALSPTFPPMAYIGAAILGVSAALLASIYPAERAARLDVVAALAYE